VGQHSAAAARAEIAIVAGEGAETILPTQRRFWIGRRWRGKQIAAERQLGGAMTVGEKSDVADPVETVRHSVLQEAADECVGRERHDFGFAVLAIVLPGETDLAIVEPNQAAVGDGDAVRVAGKISEHLLGPGERRLGEDDPVDLGQRFEPASKGSGIGQCRERPGTAEFVVGEGGVQLLEEAVSEMAGQHAHGQEEPRFAANPARLVGRDPAAGDDAVKMGVQVQRLSPGVQHRDRADLGAEVASVGGNAAQRLCRGAKQNGVDCRLVGPDPTLMLVAKSASGSLPWL